MELRPSLFWDAHVKTIDLQKHKLCSALFEKPITEFRCYKRVQSNPQHWDY